MSVSISIIGGYYARIKRIILPQLNTSRNKIDIPNNAFNIICCLVTIYISNGEWMIFIC